MSSQTDARRRGRPRKYATKEAEAIAVAQQKRAKRRRTTTKNNFRFYSPNEQITSRLCPASSLPFPPTSYSSSNIHISPPGQNATPPCEPVYNASDYTANFDDELPPTLGSFIENEDEAAVNRRPDDQASHATLLGSLVNIDEDDSDQNEEWDELRVPSNPNLTTTPSSPLLNASHPLDNQNASETECLARHLTDQLLGSQGCCIECHGQAASEHDQEFEQHTSLATFLDFAGNLCPDLLGSGRLASKGDDLANQTTPDTRRQLYCGLVGERAAPHICLRADEPHTEHAGITFDIDSVTGFTDIAIAKQGIRWHSSQMPRSDLQSSLHLRRRKVYYTDSHGHPHSVLRAVHQIPHYTFGRVVGFEDISLYFLFPHLYREDQQSSRLRDEDFRLWMDGILLPIIYRQFGSAYVQHFPSSHDHARYNATARGVETRSQRVQPIAREQQLISFLQPEQLVAVWEAIDATVQQPGFHQFRDVTVLLHAKNLKVLTKDSTWDGMYARFQRYWERVIDERYQSQEFYFDVAREVCPIQPSRTNPRVNTMQSRSVERSQDMQVSRAETLLWKRCCLEAVPTYLQRGLSKDTTAKQTYYPFSMLSESGSLTVQPSPSSAWQQAGLLYMQHYSSVKEVFTAGDVYPFTNTAIETLALDRKLRKTWALVGGGLSHNPAALMKAYLHTKARCDAALRGSLRKSFGVREEYRISQELLRAVDAQVRYRERHQQHLSLPTGQGAPFYSFTTVTLLRWLRWNINKFCLGFETVYSFQDPHFVTWEHTRVMLMFLRCLHYSYGSGLIQRSGGCWQDVREQIDDDQPNGIRRWEGLGFRHTMETLGYAWFLDKVDWTTFTFKPAHAPYMMFNNPSMQAAYRSRYSQIRDVRVDFIRIDHARQQMLEFSSVPACLDLLEEYLRQLCLCVFRKDVFSQVQSMLHADSVQACLAGDVPLCYESVKAALAEEHRPPQLAYGSRVAVKNIDVLFAWLWEWRDGRFERRGWKDKPYRMLYQQSFEVIATVRGKAAARAWRRSLKQSFLQSHWMLPYPDSRRFMRRHDGSRAFVWWPTFHGGLYQYYRRRYEPGRAPRLPSVNIPHHPHEGWGPAPKQSRKRYMPYVVEVEQSLLQMTEEALGQQLHQMREDHLQGAGDEGCGRREAARQLVFQARYWSGGVEYRRWSERAWRHVRATVDDCQTAEECRLFLDDEEQKYAELSPRGVGGYERGRGARLGRSREREGGTASSDEGTSDEESLVARRRRQGQRVQQVAQRIEQHERGAWAGRERRAESAGRVGRRAALTSKLESEGESTDDCSTITATSQAE